MERNKILALDNLDAYQRSMRPDSCTFPHTKIINLRYLFFVTSSYLLMFDYIVLQQKLLCILAPNGRKKGTKEPLDEGERGE